MRPGAGQRQRPGRGRHPVGPAWSDPTHGALSGTGADGRFTYTPDSGYSGADAFQYEVRDSQGAAAIATVTLAIGAAPPSGSSGGVSGPTGSGSGNAVAAFTSPAAGCAFQSQAFQPVPPNGPAGWSFPHGLVDFVIGGCAVNGTTVSLTLTFPQALPPGATYWKWGPQTPGGPDVWYQMPGVTISGNQVSFTLTDGALGDDDLSANGVIVDAGGPAVPAAAPPGGDGVAAIPTVSEWGLILLTLLLGGVATGSLQRTRAMAKTSSRVELGERAAEERSPQQKARTALGDSQPESARAAQRERREAAPQCLDQCGVNAVMGRQLVRHTVAAKLLQHEGIHPQRRHGVGGA